MKPLRRWTRSTIVEILKGYSTNFGAFGSAWSTIVEILKGYSTINDSMNYYNIYNSRNS